MKCHKKSYGFTLIEIMLVVILLGIIFSLSSLSYTSVRNRAYDSERQSDIQEIRLALEQYRSNNNVYPTAVPTLGMNFGSGALNDAGGNIYMSKLPQDPRYPEKQYFYETSGTDFTLYTSLGNAEPTPCAVVTPAQECGTRYECNYCFGPNGKK